MSKKTKILIVDDEREIALVLGEFLVEEGYEVAIAHNGFKALDLFVEFEPDMVLSDNMMPFMSGIELLKKFREMPGFLSTPFIIMSAAPLGKGSETETETPTEFLRKPLDVDMILKIIKRFS